MIENDEARHRVTIKFRIESREDDWSGLEAGETLDQSHRIVIEVDDDKAEAVAAALIRLLEVLNPPRRLAMLAELVDRFREDADETETSAEVDFVNAAFAVQDHWEKADAELDELAQDDGEET